MDRMELRRPGGVKTVNANTLNVTVKVNDKLVSSGRVVLSKDGKTMTSSLRVKTRRDGRSITSSLREAVAWRTRAVSVGTRVSAQTARLLGIDVEGAN